MSNQMKLGHQRSMQLTGIADPNMVRTWGVIANEVQSIAGKIAAAPPEQRDALSQQYAGRIQQLYQMQQQAVDGVATKWAGGNKKLLPLAQAFLSGSPLNSSTAVAGLIEMARTNGSFGGGMSGPAQDALNTARAIVAADAKSKPGLDAASMMASPESRAQHEQELQTRVSQAIGQTYANGIFHRVLQNAPAIAHQIGHPGQNLDPTILHQAQTAGDSQGIEVIASRLNITPAQAQQMFTQGASSPIFAQAKHGDQSYGQWASQLQVAQLQSTYRILDSTHPNIGHFKAGQVYANLLGSDRFAQAAGSLNSMQGQASFGDSIMSTMGNGGMQGQISQFGQIARSAYNAMGQRDMLMRVAHANRYGNDALARGQTIIGAIPGIQPADRDALMAAIRPALNQTPSFGQAGRAKLGMGGFGSANPNGVLGGALSGANSMAWNPVQMDKFVMLRDAIVSGHFQDPKLEAIRKIAAKHFDDYTKVTDDAIESLGAYTPGN
jgi:hypothetical protein